MYIEIHLDWIKKHKIFLKIHSGLCFNKFGSIKRTEYTLRKTLKTPYILAV